MADNQLTHKNTWYKWRLGVEFWRELNKIELLTILYVWEKGIYKTDHDITVVKWMITQNIFSWLSSELFQLLLYLHKNPCIVMNSNPFPT